MEAYAIQQSVENVDELPENAQTAVDKEAPSPSPDVEALHRRLAEHADELLRLNTNLEDKTAECAALVAER